MVELSGGMAGGRGIRVLVTDASTPAAVATVRSLGRRGVEVLAAWQGATFPLAATSRHCSGVLRLPDPFDEPDAYADRLLRSIRRAGIDALVPISDLARTAASPVRAAIEESAVYCAPPDGALAAAEDKWSILDRAGAAGLGVPPARLVSEPEEWPEARDSLGASLVFRSRRSLVRHGTRYRQPPTKITFTRAAADAEIAERLALGEPTVVTPYRLGTGRGVYIFMDKDRPAAWFGHRRLRETNPRGSAASAAVPAMPSTQVVAACAALASGLGMTGAVMLEFRSDAGGAPDWLVEINPRLWGSVSLAVAAGFDFPWWQLRYFTCGEVPSMPRLDPTLAGGRYLTADVRHLLHAIRGAPSGWTGPFPSRREAWDGFLAAFGEGWRPYHQSCEDPLPGLAEPLVFVPWSRWMRSR